ncbi:membrane protein [Streptomyces violarus]|uniref:NO-binding membrane sensor protein with MHYT domain n=1 Tax=Streptomyces violarus TaxID=67380 RepID=A0A7W5EZF2_9ACTN|nr:MULTISPECIES: MHYT domain-containing protein [Streptomyces]MBB3074400.1 NO-binding membrane sensor protein with MHYT domain [Streptomyces violarus]WRT97096.1 MHYT domain-containing protein [Streptomyces sp. CGMCC 4.1772]GHC99022.1 membrane protein [Streptomyces violarus]
MGHMDHFSAGWVTPVLSYVMACVGSALGLRCTVRALEADGASKRRWLALASFAIGSGIWTMHFVAMMGFSVEGTPIRYDVPLTVLSLVMAIAVVSAGVFTAGYGRSRITSVALGGLGTGLGVAAMHYAGMAALNLHGSVDYDPLLVFASVAIAVVAATAALTLTLIVRGPALAAVAALVMGLAVSSMHYTAMYAVDVSLAPSSAELPGATATEFLFPLAVVLGSFLFLASAYVALSPTGKRAESVAAELLREVELSTATADTPAPTTTATTTV